MLTAEQMREAVSQMTLFNTSAASLTMLRRCSDEARRELEKMVLLNKQAIRDLLETEMDIRRAAKNR